MDRHSILSLSVVDFFAGEVKAVRTFEPSASATWQGCWAPFGGTLPLFPVLFLPFGIHPLACFICFGSYCDAAVPFRLCSGVDLIRGHCGMDQGDVLVCDETILAVLLNAKAAAAKPG